MLLHCLRLFCVDLSLVLEIGLVADKVKQHITDVSIILYFVLPALHVFEALLTRYIVDHDDGAAPFVKYPCDGPVALLTGRVPNLQRDLVLIVNFHHVAAEFDAYSDLVLILKYALDQLVHDT